MEKPDFYFDKSSKLFLYDSSISSNIYFQNELVEGENYLMLNKYRYIISCENLKGIYISTLQCYEVDDGFMLEIYDNNILLIPVGKNIFYLASYHASKQHLDCMLYTFIKDHNCVIDVTKFSHLFKESNTKLQMYKKLK